MAHIFLLLQPNVANIMTIFLSDIISEINHLHGM